MTSSHTSDNSSDSQLATQEASQVIAGSTPKNPELNHLWGYLAPLAGNDHNQMDFARTNRKYTVGRLKENNDFALSSAFISVTHCEIHWNGMDSPDSVVTVTDLSTNGTFMNGILIGRNKRVVIHDGDTLAFGTLKREGLDSYHFLYRHLAVDPTLQGIEKNYRLHEEIGKGAFATVVKASHRTMGGWYAIKIIRIDTIRRSAVAEDETSLSCTDQANTIREIQILRQLEHRNICQLKEFFVERDRISLVLELVEGGDLLKFIVRYRGLQESQARPITAQICSAVAYMHSLGIAHRDLKPANILLTTDEPPIVKVADFGLAKILDESTMLRTMCGTPSYLAPEVVRYQNHRGYDLVVDNWSLGAVIFSMLTGRDPYVYDDRAVDLMGRLLSRRVNWPVLDEVGVSAPAQQLIGRLLEVDPVRRMTSADALRHPWITEEGQASSVLPPSLAGTPNSSDVATFGPLTPSAEPPTADQKIASPRTARRRPYNAEDRKGIRRSSRLEAQRNN